ncbi:MAG: choice-of-anchor A family protein, partial [Oscillospiraceae bacterium]|nr:choice-of-anchor A family protein [Oscillospiraceae bacterium]
MVNVIEEIRNADKKKKRFLSALTAAFMSFTTLGSSLSVYADRADSISEIENVTGNAQKKAELLDVPDAEDKFLGMAGDFTIFVKDKFTIPQQSADIEGRVAAGGGIENERGTYDIGSKYTGKGATVITGGGNIEQILPTAANGAENRIFAVTSDTNINKDDYSQYLKNFYIVDDLIDFDAEFAKVEQLSSEIKGYEPTGELKEQWGAYSLIGKEDGVNVFNIPEGDWEAFSKSNFIQIYVPGKIMDQYVFINVPGSGDVDMPHYSLEFVQYEADSDGNPVLDEGGQIKVLDKLNVQQDSRKEDGSFTDNMLLCGHILY